MDNKMENDKKLIIPLVIREETENDKIVYYGFAPGYPTNKVASLNIDVVKKNLVKEVKETVVTMLQNNAKFPLYVPTEEQIKSGYDGVCFIKYLELNK